MGFARLTRLCELPQRRDIMAARSSESHAAIGGKQLLDETAVAQPRKRPVHLLDRNIVNRHQPPLAHAFWRIAGKRVVAPITCQRLDNLFRRSIEHDPEVVRFCPIACANGMPFSGSAHVLVSSQPTTAMPVSALDVIVRPAPLHRKLSRPTRCRSRAWTNSS